MRFVIYILISFYFIFTMAGAASDAPFLSVSVTDPVKLGVGMQAYISYRVSTKVRGSHSWLAHSRIGRLGNLGRFRSSRIHHG